MVTKETLNETLADAVMDRPREFFIGDRRFCLWSPSLGMSMMIERHLALLDIDREVMADNPSMEVLRLVEKNREEVCYILSILSFRVYSDLSDSTVLKSRADFFGSALDDEEIARLFLFFLNDPKVEQLLALSGIAAEQQEQSAIMQVKNHEGRSRSFGGKTIYGILIDAACKAYGWTKEYVVWGIDLVSLRMMMADSINSVYLSDEEARIFGARNEKKDTIGMEAEDFDKLKKEFCD